MKNLILYIAVFICSINTINSQDKIYSLTEVDVAPILLKYKNVDSLDSKQNFKRNIKKAAIKNLDILTTNHVKNRVFIEFVIKKKQKD